MLLNVGALFYSGRKLMIALHRLSNCVVEFIQASQLQCSTPGLSKMVTEVNG